MKPLSNKLFKKVLTKSIIFLVNLFPKKVL